MKLLLENDDLDIKEAIKNVEKEYHPSLEAFKRVGIKSIGLFLVSSALVKYTMIDLETIKFMCTLYAIYSTINDYVDIKDIVKLLNEKREKSSDALSELKDKINEEEKTDINVEDIINSYKVEDVTYQVNLIKNLKVSTTQFYTLDTKGKMIVLREVKEEILKANDVFTKNRVYLLDETELKDEDIKIKKLLKSSNM